MNGETSYEKIGGNTFTKTQDSIKGIENSNRQRREQANKQLWEKLDIRIVTGEENHQRTRNGTENQTIRTLKQDTERETEKSPQDQQIVQNAIIFADDAKLLSENDTHGQMNERMGNYDIITETRHLEIQCGEKYYS